jgi:hypothetical protein
MKKILFDFWISVAMVILFLPVLLIVLLATTIDFALGWRKTVVEIAYEFYDDDADSPE